MDINNVAKAPALYALLETMNNREKKGTEEEEQAIDYMLDILNKSVSKSDEKELKQVEEIVETFIMAMVKVNNEKAKTEKE